MVKSRENIGKGRVFGGLWGVGQGRGRGAEMAGFSRHKARLTWPAFWDSHMKIASLSGLLLALLTVPVLAQTPQPHNIIIFVADGLRYGSVEPGNMPNMFKLKTEGVDFTNSHSLFPT